MAARRTSTSRPADPVRTRTVWLALLGAMTTVGGLLVLLDGRPAAVQGMTLTPLVATGTTQSLSTIFRTRQPLATERWSHIMIHHSGAPAGSPAMLEQQHRGAGLRSLGHHFVIGNGRGMEDGELHVGLRWLDQQPGAHAAGEHGDAFNQVAISICLVGDGNRQAFSRAQMDRLVQLVRSLQQQFNIPARNVVLHSAAAPVSDPGTLFPVAWLREQVAQR